MRAAAALALALLAAACASSAPQPTSIRDPAADFAAFRTYGWVTTSPPSDQPVKLLDRNIRTAIAAEMQRRGYAEVEDKPDLRIAYETASAQYVENNPVRVGVGVGGWSGNVGGSVNMGSPSIRNYQEGSLVIHVIDAARNAEVWQGRIAGRLTNGSLEPTAIAQAVAQAMRDFPARAAP